MIPQPFTVATSRYQAHTLIVASGLAPIRITLGKPKMRLPYQLAGEIQALAPTPMEFRIQDEQRFADTYCSRLDGIGVDAVAKLLTVMNRATGGNGLVLLCFDDLRTSWCHRRVLSKFLEDVAGWTVPELVET